MGANPLAAVQRLRSLDLSRVTVVGSVDFSQLGKLSRLEELNVSDCRAFDDQGLALAQGARQLRKYRYSLRW